MTSIGLVLDFVGVTLIAISSVGFVDLPGGRHYAPASLITSGRTRRALLRWGWSPRKPPNERAGWAGGSCWLDWLSSSSIAFAEGGTT